MISSNRNPKYFLCILMICSISYGQLTKDIKKKIQLITKVELTKDFSCIMPIADSTGFYALPEIVDDVRYKRENWFLHVEDLNGDGRNDLIRYDRESIIGFTSIFLNDGNTMKEVFSYGSIPLAIETDENESVIYLFTPNCCCLYHSTLIELTIGCDNQIKKEFIQYHYDTENEIRLQKFKNKIVSGILRTQPRINDSLIKDDCTPKILKGNQIRKLINEEVIVIKSKENWDLAIQKIGNDFYEIGWIQDKIKE